MDDYQLKHKQFFITQAFLSDTYIAGKRHICNSSEKEFFVKSLTTLDTQTDKVENVHREETGSINFNSKYQRFLVNSFCYLIRAQQFSRHK